MARQSKGQEKTIARTMRTYKKGALTSGSGRKVKNPKQAVAIGLSEAGASRKSTAKSKSGRAAGSSTRTATTATRGRGRPAGASTATATTTTRAKAPAPRRARRGADLSAMTRLELYQKARKENIPGRARMSKAELIQHLS